MVLINRIKMHVSEIQISKEPKSNKQEYHVAENTVLLSRTFFSQTGQVGMQGGTSALKYVREMMNIKNILVKKLFTSHIKNLFTKHGRSL
jgi:hypothetical protein